MSTPITPRDTELLLELARRHLSRPEGQRGYVSVGFDELAAWGAQHGLDADALKDLIEVLESNGCVDVARVMAKYPHSVRPTSVGVETVVRAILGEYDAFSLRLADLVLDGAQHRGAELASALNASTALVEHALRFWQFKDWVTLSQTSGDLHLVSAKVELRRWRDQAVSPATAPEPAPTLAAPVSPVARARRTWGGKWEAISDKPETTRGQGAVWKVRDVADASPPWQRRTYALKELRHPKSATSTAFRRFEREVNAMRSISGSTPGIVAVVDADLSAEEGKRQPYYVMPWADSTLERAKFLKGPASLERVLQIGISIADALIACHTAVPMVVHRDVKPANVLLEGADLIPKLADFGICFLEDQERLTGIDANTVGSAGFTAPELEGGGTVEGVGPTADIYSLGKTLYAVVSGGDVFPREYHREERFNLEVQFADARLAHLHGLLDRMVATNVEDRYASMEICRTQLQSAVDNLRTGVEYEPGMYGPGETPMERSNALQRLLIAPATAIRNDGIVFALDRSFAAATAASADFATKHPHMPVSLLQPYDAGLPFASEIAEHLLSVALPLIRHDEQGHFDEWLERASRLVSKGGLADAPAGAVLVAGVVLAMYGAAAVAWERRRGVSLGKLVRRHAEAGRDWIHLRLLGESAGRTLPWVSTSLTRSKTLSAVLKPNAARLAEVSAAFSALHAFGTMIELPASDQALLEELRLDEVYLPAFPVCYAESTEWADLLAIGFGRSRVLEIEVAREAFGLDATALRSSFARFTRAFLRRAARLRAEINRDGFFGLGAEWNAWCSFAPK